MNDHVFVDDEDALLPVADREKLLQVFQPLKLKDNPLSKILQGATMPPVKKLTQLNVWDVREAVKNMAANQESLKLLLEFVMNYNPSRDVTSSSRVVDEKPANRDQVQGYEGCKRDYDTLIGNLLDTVLSAALNVIFDDQFEICIPIGTNEFCNDVCSLLDIASGPIPPIDLGLPTCEEICDTNPNICECTGAGNIFDPLVCTAHEAIIQRNTTTWGRQSKYRLKVMSRYPDIKVHATNHQRALN